MMILKDKDNMNNKCCSVKKLATCELAPETKKTLSINVDRDTLARLQKLEPDTPIEQLVEAMIESFDW